jgi:hypothetical protein
MGMNNHRKSGHPAAPLNGLPKKITNHKFQIDWIARRGPHSGSGSNMNPCIPNPLVGRPTDRTHYPGDSAPLLPLLDQYIYNLSNLYMNYILNLVWANLTVMTMAILWLPSIQPQTIRYTHVIPPANMWIPSYMDSCIKMNKIYQKKSNPSFWIRIQNESMHPLSAH